MPAHPLPRLAAALLALGLAGLAPSARALDFVLVDIGTTPMTAQQFAAIQTAASYWTQRLDDHVTVYLGVAFSDLGANVLADTRADRTTLSWGDLRGHLAADASSATDASAVGHLQAGTALSFQATQGDLTTRFDNDASVNNRLLYVNTANAKALGLATVNDATTPDARISFANAFAGEFAYARVNGQVPAGKTDFITVAEHEIGHALGFLSGVDDVDFCLSHAAQCGLSGTAGRFEDTPWYLPLDLFRYSAPNALDVAVGGAPYFSVDGGATALASFSTGVAHGNGAQASHFGIGTPTLMQPYVSSGASYNAECPRPDGAGRHRLEPRRRRARAPPLCAADRRPGRHRPGAPAAAAPLRLSASGSPGP